MNVFRKNDITVRQLNRDDERHLVRWLSDPAVLQYYEGRDRPHDAQMVREHFYDEQDETIRCMVEYRERPIGYIQYYVLEEDERHEYGYDDVDEIIYGTDQFIGEPDYWNKGIGSLLVQSMVAFLVEQKKAQRVVMDPQAWNARAIHCYEKCGFLKVKLLKAREWHEGEMRDCWLMEYRHTSPT